MIKDVIVRNALAFIKKCMEVEIKIIQINYNREQAVCLFFTQKREKKMYPFRAWP